MAEYPAIVLTNAGLDMIAESQTGRSLIFTKLKIGDGMLGTGESISTLTALKSPKLDIPIQGLVNQGNGQVRLRYLVDNSGVPVNQGFFAREVGIYAKLDESGTERLYAYANGGNKVDWVPDLNTPMDAQIFDVFVLIGNASNVSIVIDGSATYATILDLTEHNDDPNAHGSRFLKLTGGTMTGPLVLAADPSANMQAATKKYADENGGINLWRASRAYAVGDVVYSKNATSYKYMQCTVAGTTAATEPTWPAVGQTVTDGTITWVVRDIRTGEQIGTIKPWLANAAPPGWLALDIGAEVSRDTYPQLWAWVQVNAPLITEAAWQAQAAAQSSVGAYSSGDGSTTFRLPRIVDYLRGGLAADVGTWQGDQNLSHGHDVQNLMTSTTGGSSIALLRKWDSNAPVGPVVSDALKLSGGDEARPKTIRFLFCVKAFDAPVNQGLIDITELANEMAGKVNLADFIGANQSLTGNGWQKLPGGLILQWGNSVATWAALGSDALATITFNIAFNTVFAATTNPRDGTTVDTYGVNIHAISNTGMTVRYDDNRSASATQMWIAIGK
ncbi:MAG TPA: phage tail protein [Selenomonadales bacterium]|nr:phage tail protein [Selenomonadales bacterium]